MPRTYEPNGRKQYKKYSDLAIHAALREYESTNMSLAEISKKHNITKSVLHRHNTRFMKKQGGQTVLSPEEEDFIIEYLNHCSEWGYPLDTYDLRVLVKGYLDRVGVEIKKFRDNLPGPDFVRSFLRRNKNKISLRISQNIKRSRANVSPESIDEYFEELKQSLEGVPLANIINYDETNLSDDPGRRKILTKRGAKYPERVMNHSKASTSLMMAASADGTLLPCYVVYKAKNLYESWVQQGPKGCRYNCTTSGWFDSKTFEDWVYTVALPYFKEKEGKKVLIGDNLSSHLSLNLIKNCKEQNVHFIFLPANSSHITQPLDVAFFRPTKGAWRDILFSWKKTDGRNLPTIPKSIFPTLLKKLLNRIECQASSNILAGFMKSGISPLNKDKVIERLPGQKTRDEQNFKDAIGQTVVQILKEMRYGTGNNKPTNRRKKIEVKPGQSVCTENEESEISDREYNQEQSSCVSNESNEADSEENLELSEITKARFNAKNEHQKNTELQPILSDTTKPQHLIAKLNSITKEEMKPRSTIIAKLIPEERKRKFEEKYEKVINKEVAANKVNNSKKSKTENLLSKETRKQSKEKKDPETTIMYNKINKCNKKDDVFKKPYDVRELNKTETKTVIKQKQNSGLKIGTEAVDNKLILDYINLNDFSGINDTDIEKMPILFDDNFCVQEFIDIPQYNKQENNKENEEVVIMPTKNLEKGNMIEVTSNKIFEKKVKIDLKKMKKVALKDSINTKNKKYYTKDEDILRELMDKTNEN